MKQDRQPQKFMGPFHKKLWAHNPNLVNIIFVVILILIIQLGLTYGHDKQTCEQPMCKVVILFAQVPVK